MSKTEIKKGSYVTYKFGLFPDKVYIYLDDMKNSVALCEDKEGNKWQFSKAEITLATEEQKKKFISEYKI